MKVHGAATGCLEEILPSISWAKGPLRCIISYPERPRGGLSCEKSDDDGSIEEFGRVERLGAWEPIPPAKGIP